CHRCFPETPAGDFVLRETFLKTQLAFVDRFLAPSAFLRDRYLAWGIDPERIEVMRNGIPAEAPTPHRGLAAGGRRNRFAFFGHINKFKGAMLALEAARQLADDEVSFSLSMYGGLEFQAPEFQERFREELRAVKHVRYGGGYQRDELARLIADADWVVVP